jgi:hypothetical protein
VPLLTNYQGILKDSEGNLLSGYYNMTFRLYDDVTALATDARWVEQHLSVTVRDGRFTVLLGNNNPLPTTLFSSRDRFIGVTVEPYDEMVPRQRFASVPYAMNAGDGVPVGAVIDWWRPNASFPLPEGYQVCNGSVVNDPDSPLNGQTLPNLNGRFIRGVTDPNSIGGAGGAANHTHSIDHNHGGFGLTTSTNGNHNHMWAYQSGNSWYSYNSAGGSWLVREHPGNGIGWEGEGLYPLAHTGSANYYTTNNGNHNHTATVDVPAYGGTSGSTNHLPPYVGLLKLCRIK